MHTKRNNKANWWRTACTMRHAWTKSNAKYGANISKIKSYVKVVGFPELSVLNSEIPKVYWVYQLRMCERNLCGRSETSQCSSPQALEVYPIETTSVYKYRWLKNLVMAWNIKKIRGLYHRTTTQLAWPPIITKICTFEYIGHYAFLLHLKLELFIHDISRLPQRGHAVKH